MRISKILLFVGLSAIIAAGCKHRPGAPVRKAQTFRSDSVILKNPVIPGYFANPCIIGYEGKYYLYTTIDPWGGYELAVWESDDLYEWIFRGINWPSKTVCTSPNSSEYLVGHASVVRTEDDRFFMFVTVGSEIWAGTSDHPLGPWYNLLQSERPLIRASHEQGIRNSGAECFIDPEQGAFLYWTEYDDQGRRRCRAGKLMAEMNSFTEEPVSLMVPDYYGTPYIMKHGGRYFMLYSQGNYVESQYRLRYAYSDTPLGPWISKDYGILNTDPSGTPIIGPGYPSVLNLRDRHYLFYQVNDPSDDHILRRQICMNELIFDTANCIVPVVAGKDVIIAAKNELKSRADLHITDCSSRISEDYPPENAVDGNFGSIWIPASDDVEPTLIIDLGERRKIMTVYMWMEYSILIYRYLIEYSSDGKHWKVFSDQRANMDNGAPRFDVRSVRTRYLRISFPKGELHFYRPAIWEIKVE